MASNARLHAAINAARLSIVMATLELAIKANFNPNQPRVPSGNPDGGQWTGSGSGSSSSSPNLSRTTTTSRAPRSSPLRVPGVTDHDTHFQLDSGGPAIPKQRPVTIRQANRIGWGTAKWIARTALRGTPVGRLIEVVDAASWLYSHRADILAYLDEPRTLDELREQSQEQRAGYHRHHIAEQTAARRDGYPEELIEGQENTVGVSAYRHRELTGWFITHNEEFGFLSPREVLRRSSWEERVNMGLRALRHVKVLRP